MWQNISYFLSHSLNSGLGLFLALHRSNWAETYSIESGILRLKFRVPTSGTLDHFCLLKIVLSDFDMIKRYRFKPTGVKSRQILFLPSISVPACPSQRNIWIKFFSNVSQKRLKNSPAVQRYGGESRIGKSNKQGSAMAMIWELQDRND